MPGYIPVPEGLQDVDESNGMPIKAQTDRPALSEQLRAAGLRPTRQRLALARLLFGDGSRHRHVSAEELHTEAMDHQVRVSLATVYNTLHQFTDVGLLREITVESGRSCFDTNTGAHHHFYFEQSGELRDVQWDQVVLAQLPEPPDGCRIVGVDVVIRVAG